VEKHGDLTKWESVAGTGPGCWSATEPTTKMTSSANPNYFPQGLPYVDAVELTVDPTRPRPSLPSWPGIRFRPGVRHGGSPEHLALQEKIGWYLQTRELLIDVGGLRQMKLDQDPFTRMCGCAGHRMADNWHEVLEAHVLSTGKGDQPLVPAALKSGRCPSTSSPRGRKLYEADPVRARQLLAEAGYKSGHRNPVETTRGTARLEDAVNIEVKTGKAAGLQVDLKVKDYSAFMSSSLREVRQDAADPARGPNRPDWYLTPLCPRPPPQLVRLNDPKLTEMIKLPATHRQGEKAPGVVYDIQRHFSSRSTSPSAPR